MSYNYISLAVFVVAVDTYHVHTVSRVPNTFGKNFLYNYESIVGCLSCFIPCLFFVSVVLKKKLWHTFYYAVHTWVLSQFKSPPTLSVLKRQNNTLPVWVWAYINVLFLMATDVFLDSKRMKMLICIFCFVNIMCVHVERDRILASPYKCLCVCVWWIIKISKLMFESSLCRNDEDSDIRNEVSGLFHVHTVFFFYACL